MIILQHRSIWILFWGFISVFIILPLLSLVGCSSIRWITTDHGQIITDRQQRVSIVGNLEMACYDVSGNVIAEGFFVKQTDDGAFVIDQYGTSYIVVPNPFCRLGPND